MSNTFETTNDAHKDHKLWEFQNSTSILPEPLYRLRISILQDENGSAAAPIRMFTFRSQIALQSAVENLSATFGGAFSKYEIEDEDLVYVGSAEGELEDGRTKGVLLKFDSETADETWKEFLGRMDHVERDWEPERLDC